MTDPVFVDTNVLLYTFDAADPVKQKLASAWYAALWRSGAGRISYQVLQEFYSKIRQKWPSASDGARAVVRELLVWHPAAVNGTLLELAWNIQDRYRFSFWDSLIVAAAKVSSCRYLLTEDLHAMQVVEGLKVLNPFQQRPDSILSSN